jgi:phosphatidylserine/phosphatidylglycerophosphate/cardiolipin synthase-like enzyme
MASLETQPFNTLYRTKLTRLRKLNAESLIQNGQSPHTVILLTDLLKYAQQRVVIFATSLNLDYLTHPRVLASIQGAAARGVGVEILVQECGPNKDNPLVHLNQTQTRVNLSLYYCPKYATAIRALRGNFIVADNKSFRFAANSSVPKAVASLNRPKEARRLQNIFDSLVSSI